jgi:membrane protein YdbS with pleckstrin-like domain
MRLFSLILSALTLVVTVIALVTNFPDINSLDNIIYLGLMLLLLAICSLGIILNLPEISRVHHKYRIS